MLYYNTKNMVITDTTKFIQMGIAVTMNCYVIMGLTENGNNLLIEEFDTEKEAEYALSLMMLSKKYKDKILTDKQLNEYLNDEQDDKKDVVDNNLLGQNRKEYTKMFGVDIMT